MTQVTTRQGGVFHGNSLSRSLLVGFFLLFFVYVGQANFVLSADRPTGSASASPADTRPIEGQQKAVHGLQFMGVVDVGERQPILLLPGESVAALYCRQGDFVKKGQILLKLHNDAISSGIAELMMKKNKVKEGLQQLHLAEMEKKQREKQLQRLEEKITAENALKKQISGYASPLLQQLEMQRLTLVDQVEISIAQITSLQESAADNEEVLKLLKAQRDDLDLRRENLSIKALFDARVFFLNPNAASRLPPGSLLAELRNESFHMVKGKIIQHQRKLLKVGDSVKVSLDSSSDEAVAGAVQSIEYTPPPEHKEVPGYSTFEVMVRVDAQAQWLQAGMMVSVNK